MIKKLNGEGISKSPFLSSQKCVLKLQIRLMGFGIQKLFLNTTKVFGHREHGQGPRNHNVD